MAVDLGSADEEVRHEKGHRVPTGQVGGVGGICLGDGPQPIRVLLVPLVGLSNEVDHPPGSQEGETTDDGSPTGRCQVEHSAGVGSFDVADEMDVGGNQERRQRLKEAGRVVVARNGYHRAPPAIG
jgi:hypothetical protein